MDEAYKGQVKLLLDVLPEVAKEECFALHGGASQADVQITKRLQEALSLVDNYLKELQDNDMNAA